MQVLSSEEQATKQHQVACTDGPPTSKGVLSHFGACISQLRLRTNLLLFHVMGFCGACRHCWYQDCYLQTHQWISEDNWLLDIVTDKKAQQYPACPINFKAGKREKSYLFFFPFFFCIYILLAVYYSDR